MQTFLSLLYCLWLSAWLTVYILGWFYRFDFFFLMTFLFLTERFACDTPNSCLAALTTLVTLPKPIQRNVFCISRLLPDIHPAKSYYSQWVGVFIIKQTWHNSFLAVVALGGIIIGMTFSAQQHIIFGCECFIHQRAAALGTVETLVMPMTILVRQIL